MKKLSKIFAVVLCLALALSMLPMGASAATTEKSVKLTVDSLGVKAQAYADGTGTVSDVDFEWFHMGNYGDGFQMRDKPNEGKGPSKLWNTSAFAGGITKIVLTYSANKDVSHSNPNCMILTFGDEAQGADYSTKLSTTAGTKTYTITPDVATHTYFYLEWDLGYSSYWDSIEVFYNETTGGDTTTGGDNTTGGDTSVKDPDKVGDDTAVVAMTTMMVVAVAALAVLVINKKRMF